MSGDTKQQVRTLYLAHHGWLSGWLRGKLGDASDAADLAQDTFLRVLTGKRAEAPLTEPRAFLVHVAKGLLVDHWRRKDIERAYLEAVRHLPEAAVPSAEDHLAIVETLMRVDAALSALPARTRQIFLLAQLDGLTLQQISARTGTPVITVRRHIRKALLACLAVE